MSKGFKLTEDEIDLLDTALLQYSGHQQEDAEALRDVLHGFYIYALDDDDVARIRQAAHSTPYVELGEKILSVIQSED